MIKQPTLLRIPDPTPRTGARSDRAVRSVRRGAGLCPAGAADVGWRARSRLEAHALRGVARPGRAGSRDVSPGRRGTGRRRAGLAPSREGLDDDHVAATARAWWACIGRFRRHVVMRRRRDSEQFACAFEAGLAGSAGEQAVMADAMEAAWQHVEQETANELVRSKRHDPLPVSAVAAIFLVAEGDPAGLVVGDEPPVRDGGTVGVCLLYT